MAKYTTAQMKAHISGPFNPISITAFLYKFKLACDTNGIREGAAIWISNFFKKKPALAVPNTGLADMHKAQTGKTSTGKTTTLSTYPRVINYLLHIDSSNENIADMGDEITIFSQPPNKTPSQYAENSAAKAL